ncbi:MAG: DegV family protein [Candidatus Margulisiibacteriota bacterium]|jgi:DegV family protein with EDD domain
MKTGRRYIKVTERRINYYKISQVAKDLDISQRTIRYYEQIGLLPSSRRTKGRMRLFSEGEVKLIRKIKELQNEYHMPLENIKAKLQKEVDTFVQEREKGKVKIVVDSTSSLPTEILQKYGIEVIPMKVIFGKSVFEDGENMNTGELIKMLDSGRHNPRTSPPDYEEIVAIYNNVYERGAEKIISIHLSSGISDLVFAAKKASTYMSHFLDVEVIDSQCMALGSGLLAIEAAKMLEKGLSFNEVTAALRKMVPKVKELLLVDSLEYLTRGKDVHEFLGLLLDFKPVFTTENGKVKLLTRADNRDEIKETFVSLAGKTQKSAGIMYSFLKQDADKLHTDLKKVMDPKMSLLKTEISTVPSVYFGPKSLGIAVF